MDYTFFTNTLDQRAGVEGEQPESTPILVMRERPAAMVWGDVVSAQGVQCSFALDTAVRHLVRLGYPALQLRSDGELAIRAFGEEVMKALKEKGIRVAPSKTPKADSQSAGPVENAADRLQG